MAAYISFQPSDNYNSLLYNGTGSSQAVTGLGFQPDMVWMKNRVDVRNNNLFDVLRGVFMNLITNTNAAEASATNSLTSFDSDGFTVQDSNETNEAGGDGYASWSWKMGTTTGIAGSPSITPISYSFNATAGQSIIKYTGNLTAGATLPHGLGTSDIGMIIVKRWDGTASYQVFNKSLGATKYLELNTDGAVGTSTTRWNDTAPTSTLFSLGNNTDVNGSGDNYIAYVFAQKSGYSKFSSYTGNGNADGTFCYTGFQPNYVMIKRYDSTNDWKQMDNKRPGYNLTDKALNANTSGSEDTSDFLDILSNGFKTRRNAQDVNGDGSTYVYAAWAKFPFVSSNSIPTTAK